MQPFIAQFVCEIGLDVHNTVMVLFPMWRELQHVMLYYIQLPTTVSSAAAPQSVIPLSHLQKLIILIVR